MHVDPCAADHPVGAKRVHPAMVLRSVLGVRSGGVLAPVQDR